jgi:transposase
MKKNIGTKKKVDKKATTKPLTMSMSIVRQNVGAIDVGSKFNIVCVGEDVKNDFRKFGQMTEDLQSLSLFFQSRGEKTIVMESTAHYWQPIFDVLQSAGFDVFVVNGRDVKNPDGTKNDYKDALHLYRLHSLGMTKNSYLPDAEADYLRTFVRYRQDLMRQSMRTVHHIQKTLRRMNICLEDVLNDVVGASGRAILEAIIAGERDAEKLYLLTNYTRLKASKADIIRALTGNWREDNLYFLTSEYHLHLHLGEKIAELDVKINDYLSAQSKTKVESELLANGGVIVEKPALSKDRQGNPRPYKRTRKHGHKNEIKFELQQYAYDLLGTDLYAIPGVGSETVLLFLSEIGTNVDKFPSAGHFKSWLGLCPNHRISGGKILSRHTKRSSNRFTVALRQGASTVKSRKEFSKIKHLYHRVAGRSSKSTGIVAAAGKIAATIYHCVKNRCAYQEQSEADYHLQHRDKHLSQLRKRIASLTLTEEEKTALFKVSQAA